MARAPSGAAASMMADPMAGGAGGMGTDPMAGGGAGAGDTDNDGDQSDNVVVTITKSGDGSYMVYSGDEPDSTGGDTDMSGDDAAAAGAGGAAGGAGGAAGDMGGGSGSGAAGQPADSVGAALKIAMDILQSDKSSEGAPGNADDQLAAGFSASKSPTPASGPSSKY